MSITPRARRIVGALLPALLCLLLALLAPAQAWGPAPHDDAHLILLRHGRLKKPGDAKKKVVRDGNAPMSRSVLLDGPIIAEFTVEHAGRYHLWLHLSGPGADNAARPPAHAVAVGSLPQPLPVGVSVPLKAQQELPVVAPVGQVVGVSG